jgi:hypothetical protein
MDSEFPGRCSPTVALLADLLCLGLLSVGVSDLPCRHRASPPLKWRVISFR